MGTGVTPERTLTGYVDAVSQPSPAPGAGSVAAIVGSLGCALGEMVCGITLNNPKIEPDERLRRSHQVVTNCRARLLELASQDEEAYSRFRAAQAMPKSDDDQKHARAKEMARTLKLAAEVPLRIAETSADALEELIIIAKLGSKHALADVSTAAYALEASVRGALENVWVNLRMMNDPEMSDRLRNRGDATLLRYSLAVYNATAAVDRRSPDTKE
ncbi:cyclodeaminase/cyclohydrolase family protein [soil metagenome]